MKKEHSNYYKICPNCNFFCHVNEPDEFCSKCGEKLIAKCTECGHSIDNPYAKFCKYCGVSLPGRKKEGEIEF